MDGTRFDALARRFAVTRSRRQTLAALTVGAVALRLQEETVSAGDGCRDLNKKCKRGSQCCSGVCKGKKGKKKCKAHDASTCVDGDTTCGLNDIDCTTTLGAEGRCFTTTGNAPFCSAVGPGGVACFTCTRDADCVPDFGAGAACVQCTQCEDNNFVACARLSLP